MADIQNNEPVAYFYELTGVGKELVLDCNGEYARRLLEAGYTETPLFTRAAPPAMDREALQKGLEFAVLTLAFHGRDRGTDREAKMLDDLEQLARELDPLMRRALVAIDSRSGHPDDEAVDRFAVLMKAKLSAARAKGRRGWDDPDQCSTDYLRQLLHEHVAKGDPVDVANFCMMLAHYGASTALSADAIRQGEGWQDIGCAPKDGTDILAWSEEYGVRQTRMGRYTPGSPGFAAWERGDGPLNHGWVWIEEKHNSAHSWKPTHWMPLPATPASHASDGGKA